MKVKNELKDNVYVQNKMLWLEENYSLQYSTKQVYLDFIVLYALPVEEFKEKDLFLFTSSEIVELFNNLPKIKERNASTLWSAINNYLSWASQRGLCPQGNPCDGLNFRGLIPVNIDAIKNTYISLQDFWYKVETYHRKYDVSYKFLATAVLYRYGIPNKLMPNLKWKDINSIDMSLCVYTKDRDEILLMLPIDEDFVDFMKKLCNEEEKHYMDNSNNNTLFIDDSYVVSSRSGNCISASSVNTRYNIIFERVEDVRLRINDLLNSRKYDILYSIYKEKGEVTLYDIRDVDTQFVGKTSYSGEFNLKKDFEVISGVHIRSKREM